VTETADKNVIKFNFNSYLVQEQLKMCFPKT